MVAFREDDAGPMHLSVLVAEISRTGWQIRSYSTHHPLHNLPVISLGSEKGRIFLKNKKLHNKLVRFCYHQRKLYLFSLSFSWYFLHSRGTVCSDLFLVVTKTPEPKGQCDGGAHTCWAAFLVTIRTQIWLQLSPALGEGIWQRGSISVPPKKCMQWRCVCICAHYMYCLYFTSGLFTITGTTDVSS